MEKVKLTEAEIKVRVDNEYKNNYILTHTACIDIAGDLIAGMLLDRIMYWFSVGENGKRRVRVVRDGYYWLTKQRTDWYDELRISPKQYDRASKILAKKGLIHTAKYRFNGVIQIHLRPDYEVYSKLLEEWKEEQAEKIRRQAERENERIDAYNEIVPLISDDEYEDYENYDGFAEKDDAEYEKYKSSFESLWAEYPKKVGKDEAFEAYSEEKRKNNTSDKIILNAIIAYKQYIEKNNIQYRYIKNGSTWFKQRAWNDEYKSTTDNQYEVYDDKKYDYKELERKIWEKQKAKE